MSERPPSDPDLDSIFQALAPLDVAGTVDLRPTMEDDAGDTTAVGTVEAST